MQNIPSYEKIWLKEKNGFGMNKLLLMFFLISLSGCSNEEKPSNSLDQRIESLQTQINALDKKALNEEVEGVDVMRNDYKKFSQDLESSEQDEEKARALKQELKALILEKKKSEAK